MNRSRFLLSLFLWLVILALGLVRINATMDAPPSLLRLRSRVFDPLITAKDVNKSPPRDGLYLVQFIGPVQPGWKDAVEAKGVRLYDYIPENAFIARLDAGAADGIRGLPFVRWVGPFRAEYRLAPDLMTSPTGELDASAPLTLTLQALPDADMTAIEEQITALGGRVLFRGNAGLAQYARVVAPRSGVATLAAIPNVVWVEPYFRPRLYNDVAGGQIMRANQVRADLGLYGAGQIVGVADTGLDVGVTTAAMSDDFEGRIVEGQAICAYFQGGRTTWNDFNGHGTHVAGSVLGSGVLSGSNPAAHDYANSFAGVAPEAQLVFQSIDHEPGDGLECVPPDLVTYLFNPAYQKGARVHTNSWGGPTGGTPNRPEYGGYNANARQVDSMMWQHPDMLILYAAGNAGVDKNRDGVVDLDAIGSPGTAKNAITVGASESLRPDITMTWGQGWPTSYPASPIRDDKLGDNADGMAAFSSRGPTDDGRIKPDLAAPGTLIISARSHDPQAGTGWGEYNQDYIYEGGTSMATPLTAGAAAIVREWLTRLKGVANPSAALIKALLIEGAADMSPGQYGTGSTQEVPAIRPNNVSGWGRVDLAASLEPAAPQKLWFEDHRAGLNTGDQVEYAFTVGGTASSASGAPLSPPRLNPDLSLAQPFAGPSPTSPAGWVQLLQNPGWESGTWSPWKTYGHPQLTNQSPHSGAWAVHFGGSNNANDQVWQVLDVPNQTGGINLRFWYRVQTEETYSRSDRFCYGIWNESGQTAYVLRCADLGQTGSQGWVQETYSLRYLELIRVLGERVLFGFFIDTDSSLPSTVWLDDAAFEVSVSGNPTPTPTPPPAATPTPTPTTQPPTCPEMIVDGGFEQATADNAHPAWHVEGNARFTRGQGIAHQGQNAAILGWTDSPARGDLWQWVTVPAAPASATLRFWYQKMEEGGLPVSVDITNGDGSHVWLHLGDIAQADFTWRQFEHTFTPAELATLAGKTTRLRFRIQNVSAPVDFVVDDVSWTLCSGGGPTPTPTPGPGGGPLRLTLAWTDYPGSLNASKALVNDLDLEVIAPNGTHYYGNQGVYQSGPCLRDGKWDACNNVEGVIIPQAPYGTYRIIVRAHNVPQGPQPFALVVRGDNLREGTSPPPTIENPLYLPLVR